MKRNLILLLVVILFCSATKERVDQTEDIVAHQIIMEEHFAFVDKEKALKVEMLNSFIESNFESRIEDLSIQLSIRLENEEITLEQYYKKSCELKLIGLHVKEFRKEIGKVNLKQKKVYHKPTDFEFNGKVV